MKAISFGVSVEIVFQNTFRLQIENTETFFKAYTMKLFAYFETNLTVLVKIVNYKTYILKWTNLIKII